MSKCSQQKFRKLCCGLTALCKLGEKERFHCIRSRCSCSFWMSISDRRAPLSLCLNDMRLCSSVRQSVGPSVHRSHTSENTKFAFFNIAGVIHRVGGGGFRCCPPVCDDSATLRYLLTSFCERTCAITTLYKLGDRMKLFVHNIYELYSSTNGL